MPELTTEIGKILLEELLPILILLAGLAIRRLRPIIQAALRKKVLELTSTTSATDVQYIDTLPPNIVIAIQFLMLVEKEKQLRKVNHEPST